MHLSRELALDEIKETVSILQRWIDEMECPRSVLPDGKEMKIYPDGIPSMLAINEISAFPVQMFRAELAVAAAKLEAIAST